MSGAFTAALGIALISVISVTVLKGLGSSAAPVVACLGGVLIISLFAEGLVALGEGITAPLGISDASKYGSAALKVIGVGYLSGICQDSCETLGEGGICRAVGLAGKLEIMLIALPFFLEILEASISLVGG